MCSAEAAAQVRGSVQGSESLTYPRLSALTATSPWDQKRNSELCVACSEKLLVTEALHVHAVSGGCAWTHLDAVRYPSAVHTAGHIYCISPDVILRLASPNDPSHYGSNVEPCVDRNQPYLLA